MLHVSLVKYGKTQRRTRGAKVGDRCTNRRGRTLAYIIFRRGEGGTERGRTERFNFEDIPEFRVATAKDRR